MLARLGFASYLRCVGFTFSRTGYSVRVAGVRRGKDWLG